MRGRGGGGGFNEISPLTLESNITLEVLATGKKNMI